MKGFISTANLITEGTQTVRVEDIDKLKKRNIILLASAGTGKTDTLSKRIANIINRGKAKPSQI